MSEYLVCHALGNFLSLFVYPVQMLIGSVQMDGTVCTDDHTSGTSFFHDLLHNSLDLFLRASANQIRIVVAVAADHALVLEQLLAFCNRQIFGMNSPVDNGEVVILVNPSSRVNIVESMKRT